MQTNNNMDNIENMNRFSKDKDFNGLHCAAATQNLLW